MKNKFKFFLPFFFLLIFSIPLLATEWVANSIKIEGKDPTGETYHRTVSVKWSVTNEDVGDLYWLSYSVDGGINFSPCSIVEDPGGTGYPSGGGTGGDHTYTVHWDTSADISGNESNCVIRITKATGGDFVNGDPTDGSLRDGPFTIQNTLPVISITSPVDGAHWSGTQNINWDVVGAWPDDKYKVQYSYSATGDPGSFGAFTDITTVDTDVRSYSIDTTAYSDGYYKFRIEGTVSGAVSNTPVVIIDQDVLTEITITRPNASDKCRGTIRISWTVTGTPRIDDTFSLYWYDYSVAPPGDPWQLIASGISRYSTSYDWDTTALTDKQTKLKIIATSSGVEDESEEFIIDNTIPIIEEVKIIPSEPNGMIPDVEIDGIGDIPGRYGRNILMVKPSGWYADRTPTVKGDIESYPLIKVKARDPRAADQSFAGIYAIAYRTYSDIRDNPWSNWQIIPAEDMTFGPNNEWAEGSFYLNVEGNIVFAEVVAIDRATYSLFPPPNYIPEIHDLDSNCWGNYGLTKQAPTPEVEGTMSDDATLDGEGNTVFYDNTQNWTDDELVGKVVHILSGTGAGHSYEIIDNDATSFTVEGDHTADGLAGTEYSISIVVKIDVTPPDINYLKVDHLPDGPHIGDIHWYRADVNRRPLVKIVAEDNLSQVYEHCSFHTVDGTDIPLIQIPYSDEDMATYTLDPLNGEIVTFVHSNINDCPGVRKLNGEPLPNGLWFPVYNAYGKPIHARVWDKAGNISDERVQNPIYYIGEVPTSVELYVDNIPPVCTVNITNNYWPTSPLDKGTYTRGYWDIWRHNLNFSRPEDASPPAGYPQGWIDYIYIASQQNTTGLSPTTFSISVNDIPSQIVPFEKYYEIFKGDPDWEIQYDYFFSDYSEENSGSGVSATFSSPWYRYRVIDPSETDNSVLADLKGLWTDGTDIFYVGEKGVTGKWDGDSWVSLINDDMHNLNGISGQSATDIYACGDGGTLLHYDGDTWTSYSTGTTDDLLDLIKFATGTGGVCLLGENGRIMYSSNPASGIWTSHSVQDGGGSPVDLSGVNINGIWGTDFSAGKLCAVGDGGTVLLFNGGTTWILQDVPTSGNLYDVWGKDFDGDANLDFIVVGNIEYVGGDNRYIGYLYYDSDTTTWSLESTEIPSTTADNFSRIPIYGITGSGNEVYMVGAKGTVIHGVYSGGSWTWNLETLPSGVTERLFDVAIDSSGDVFVVGDSGRTLYKPNGEDWTEENLWSDWIKSSYGFTLGWENLEYDIYFQSIYTSGGVDLIDQSQTDYYDTQYPVGTTDSRKLAQSFIPTVVTTVIGNTPFYDQTKFAFYKYPSAGSGPTQGVSISLHEDDNGEPNLAEIKYKVTFTREEWNDLPDGINIIDFPATLQVGKKYWVVFSTITGQIDDNNYAVIGANSTVDLYEKGELKVYHEIEEVNPEPFTLKPGTTAIEYFAIDDLGNEEIHHKIIDPGKGTVKPVSEGKGTGNIRTDDNVPEPDILIEGKDSGSHTPPHNGWFNEPVKLILTFNDPTKWNDYLPDGVTPGSGINKFQYAYTDDPTKVGSIPDGDFRDYTYGEELLLTDGIYYIAYRAVDNVGNKNIPYLQYNNGPNERNPVKIDTQPPLTQITLDSTGGQQKFILTAEDYWLDENGQPVAGGSGVAQTQYQFLDTNDNLIDGPFTYSGPFTIDNPNVKKIEYWSIDNAGNEESHKVYDLEVVDNNPPLTQIEISNGIVYQDPTGTIYVTSNSNRSISPNVTKFRLLFEDSGVGVSSGYPRYRLYQDDTPKTDWIVPSWDTSYGNPPYSGRTLEFSIDGGTDNIRFYSQDVLGNEESVKTYSYVIDDDPPTVIANVTCDNPAEIHNGWYNSESGKPVVTLSADDGSGCGVKEIKYTLTPIDGQDNVVSYSGSFVIDDTKGVSLKYYALDNLDNQSETSLYQNNPIKVDTIPPSSSISLNAEGKFELTGVDATSGIATLYYALVEDGGNLDNLNQPDDFTVYSGPIDATGYRYICYYAVDNAGNVEEYKVYDKQQVDNIAPTTQIDIDTPSYIDANNLYVTSRDNNNPTLFTLTANDNWGGSGVDYANYPVYSFKLSDGSWTDTQHYTSSFSIPANCIDIGYKSGDLIGNIEDTKYLTNTYTLVVDDIPPEATGFDLVDNDGAPLKPADTGWYNAEKGRPRIEFHYGYDRANLPTKEGSGIAGINYGIDTPGTTPNIAYNNQRILVGEGVHTVYFAAFDRLGNVEDTVQAETEIKVDTIKPVTHIQVQNGIFEVTEVNETGSGLAYTEYRYETETDTSMPYTIYTGPVSLPNDTEKIYYRSVDIAGNVEEEKIYDLTVADQTPPYTTIEISSGARYFDGTNWFIASSANPDLTLITKFTLTSSDGSGTGVAVGYPRYKFIYEDGTESETQVWNGTPFAVPPTNASNSPTVGIEYWSKDVAGNEETHKVFNFTIDDTPPDSPQFTLTPSSPDGENNWYKSDVTVQISSEDTGSGLDAIYYSTDGTTPTNIYGGVFTLSDGIYNLVANAVDKVGNKTEDVNWTYNPIKVDTIAPVTHIKVENGVFEVTGVDETGSGLAYTEYSLNTNTDYRVYTGPVTLPNDTEKIYYRSVDIAGNVEEEKVYDLKEVDKTPPSTTIEPTSGARYFDGTNWFIASSANPDLTLITKFTLTSSDGSGTGVAVGYPRYKFIYEDGTESETQVWNGTPFAVPPTNASNSPTVGIEYWSKDVAGNEETHKVFTFTIDDTPPDSPQFTLTPSSPDGENNWYKSDVTVQISSEDTGSGLDAIYYSTDGTTPTNIYGGVFTLSDGIYNLVANAVDKVGNLTDNVTYETTVKIDTVAPVSTILRNGQEVTITATDAVPSSGVAYIEYAIGNSTSWIPSTTDWIRVAGSTAKFTLPEDFFMIAYRATDNAGNIEEYHLTNLQEEDTTPPVTTLSPVPGTPYYYNGTTHYVTSSANVNPTLFALVSDDGDGTGVQTGYPKYKISLAPYEEPEDENDGITYTTPFTVPYSDQPIRIYYWSKDVAGNIEEDAGENWKYLEVVVDDTAGYTTHIEIQPSPQPNGDNGWYRTVVQVKFTATDEGAGVDRIEYSLTGGEPSTVYTGPFTINNNPGVNLTYRCIDKLGNVEPTKVYPYNPIKVDTLTPISSLSISNQIVTITATDNLSGVAYTFYCLDYDDTEPPEKPHYNPGSGSWEFGEWKVYTAPFELPTDPVPKAIHYFSVDSAGVHDFNDELGEPVKTYVIVGTDNTPPIITLSASPQYVEGGNIYVGSVNNGNSYLRTLFTITAEDIGSGVKEGYPTYNINGTGEYPYSSPFHISGNDGDTVTIEVRCCDNAGNTSIITQQYIIDDSPPEQPIIEVTPASPEISGWYTTSPVVLFKGTGPGDSIIDTGSGFKEVRYSDEGSDEPETVWNGQPLALEDGIYFITARAVDNLGNVSNLSTYENNPIKVDTTPPSSDLNYNHSTGKITLSASDETSGVSKIKYKYVYEDDDESSEKEYEQPFIIGEGDTSGEKIKSIKYWAEDNAGNKEEENEYIVGTEEVYVEGTIREVSGLPLRDVTVKLIKLSDGTEVETTTDSNGRYSFRNLEPTESYVVVPVVPSLGTGGLMKGNFYMPLVRRYVPQISEYRTGQNFYLRKDWPYYKGNPENTNYNPAGTNSYITDRILTKFWQTINISNPQILAGDMDRDGEVEIVTLSNGWLYLFEGSPEEGDFNDDGYLEPKFGWPIPVNENAELACLEDVDGDYNLEIIIAYKNQLNLVFEIYDISGNLLYTVRGPAKTDINTWLPRMFINEKLIIPYKGSGRLYAYNFDGEDWTELGSYNMGDVANVANMAAYDLDSDGNYDLVFGKKIVHEDIWENSDNSKWDAINDLIPQDEGTFDFAISDLNNDGTPEIIAFETQQNGQGRARVRLFTLTQPPEMYTYLTGIVEENDVWNWSICDLKGDGVKEVVFTDGENNLHILRYDGANFEPLITYQEDFGTLLTASDLDGDGKAEIVSISEDGNYIVVTKLVQDNLETLWTYPLGIGVDVNSSIVCDIDHDGVVEIVLSTNEGILAIEPAEREYIEVPEAPVITEISLIGSQIAVTWTTPEGFAEGEEDNYYKVWKSTQHIPDDETREPDFTTTNNTLLDPDFAYGTTYYYRVKAHNPAGDSEFSNERTITPTQPAGGGGGGGCFIATAAYGTSLAKEVKILCRWRDEVLMKRWIGRKFVEFYYKISPPLAEFIRKHIVARVIVRILLKPIVLIVKLRFSLPLLFSLIFTTLFLFPFLLLFIKRQVKNEE